MSGAIRVSPTPIQPLNEDVSASWIFAGDVDGDRRADVVVPGRTMLQGKPSGAYFIYTHGESGAIRWSNPLIYYTFEHSPMRVVGIADETGDGRPDLITIESVPGGGGMVLSVWPQEWRGLFSTGQTIPSDLNVIDFRDVNRDTVADVIGVQGGARIYVLTGRQGGGFFAGPVVSTIPGPPIGASFRGAVVFDANLDAIDDVAIISRTGTVVVMAGTGAGSFGFLGQFQARGDAIGVSAVEHGPAAAKILLTLHRAGAPGQANVYAWSRDTTGTYTNTAALSVGVQPRFATTTDLDLDRRKDVVFGEEGNGFGRGNYVITALASGALLAEQLASEGGPDGTAADVNADGRADLLFVNSPVAPLRIVVYINESDVPLPARRRAVGK